MFFFPFSDPQKQEPGSVVIAGTSSTFFIHFITWLLKPLQRIHWNGRRTGLRVCEGKKSLVNDIFCWKLVKKINQSCLTSLWGAIAPTTSPLDPPLNLMVCDSWISNLTDNGLLPRHCPVCLSPLLFNGDGNAAGAVWCSRGNWFAASHNVGSAGSFWGVRLHGSPVAVADETSTERRLDRDGSPMDHVVCHRTDSTSGVKWSNVALSATVVRYHKGQFWALAVYPVHGRDRRGCRQSGSATAPVRGRLSALRLHADERRS